MDGWETVVPRITGIGVFDSRTVFPGQTITQARDVVDFELELFLEDGGAACINGEEHAICRGLLLCSKPGQKRNSRLPLCLFVGQPRRGM